MDTRVQLNETSEEKLKALLKALIQKTKDKQLSPSEKVKIEHQLHALSSAIALKKSPSITRVVAEQHSDVSDILQSASVSSKVVSDNTSEYEFDGELFDRQDMIHSLLKGAGFRGGAQGTYTRPDGYRADVFHYDPKSVVMLKSPAMSGSFKSFLDR